MSRTRNRLAIAAFTIALTTSISARTAVGAVHSSVSQAQRPSVSGGSGNFGLGLMFGEPTGLNIKYWLSRSGSLDFGLAYSFSDYMELLGGYTWNFPNAFGGATGSQFVPYVGLGGAFFIDTTPGYYYSPFPSRAYTYFHGYTDSGFAMGARIPLGIEFLPRSVPMGIFAEVAPGVGLFPGVFAFFQGYLGARFYL